MPIKLVNQHKLCYTLISKIKYCMQEKQYAVAVCMDVQGPFNSTTFAAIQKALERRNVGKTTMKWIVYKYENE